MPLVHAATAGEMASESFRLRGGALSAGAIDGLRSTRPGSSLGDVGVTLGQASPIGESVGPTSGIQLRAGAWPVFSLRIAAPDRDGDGVLDDEDNCRDVANPGQEDLDGSHDDDSSLPGVQHYGDACDADLDNDGIVGATDFFGVFRPCLGADLARLPDCARADLDGDGVVGATDFFGRLRPALGQPPGPGRTDLP